MLNLNAISFLNEKNGFAYNGKSLFATHDGGQTWLDMHPTFPEKSSIYTAQFFDANRALLVLQANEDYYGDHPFKHFWIYVTENGGKSWSRVYENADIIVYDINFFKDDRGFIYGTRYAKGPYISGDLFLARSTDKGASWQDISEPIRSLVKDDKSKVTYANDTIIKTDVDAKGHLRLITHSRRLLQSLDDGVSWIKSGQYLHDDAQVGIKNFGLMDDGREWMFESTYSIEGIRSRLKTVKDGKEFTRRVVGDVYLETIFYLGGESFIAAGRTGNLRRGQDRAIILATDDSANSWYEVFRSPSAESIKSLQRLDADSFRGLCSDGTIISIERLP